MTEQDAERIVRELAARERPEDVRKVDRQFGERLERLEKEGRAPREMLDQARVLWKMLAAPDEVVSFGAKAMIMGALGYLVSPLDVIPDGLGYAGHLDDAMVIRFVYGRLGPEIEAFRAHSKG
jgi:uncharacterized membrane protein YkvA (DUF1232 family)